MAHHSFLVASILFSCLAATCYGTKFSTLPKTLKVEAAPKNGSVLKAGVDTVTGSWALDPTSPPGTDSAYKTVKVKLCYAPYSQKDRAWRKFVDDLKKDKTCQKTLVTQPYTSKNTSFSWLVQRDVPTAWYFVRAYVFDSADEYVAYGQSTVGGSDLFNVVGISGRHASLDIASICFSVFSVVSLFGFFFLEKRKAKAASKE